MISITVKLLELTKILQDELKLFSTINLGKLSTERKSIALRVMPSGNVNYYGGNRSRELLFQVLTKSPNQVEAITTLEEIANKLIENECEVYSEPSFIQQDEQGYIYSASLRIYI